MSTPPPDTRSGRTKAFRTATAAFGLVTVLLLGAAFVAEEQRAWFVGGAILRGEAGRLTPARAPVWAALALFAAAAAAPGAVAHTGLHLLGLTSLVFAWHNLIGHRLGESLALPSSVPFLVFAAAGAVVTLRGGFNFPTGPAGRGAVGPAAPEETDLSRHGPVR